MTALKIAMLALTALVFIAWAVTLFRTLFVIRRRASQRTGASLPGPIETLREWRLWLGDPMTRTDKLRLLLLTIAMLALSVLNAFVPGGPA